MVTLDQARDAVEGQDFNRLTSQTNQNLDRENGQYFSGVTDDGLVVFTDGPRTIRNVTRVALMDPATGAKDWLPGDPQAIEWPLELSAQRLVFQAELNTSGGYGVVVFDRGSRTWSTQSWPALPATEFPIGIGPAAMGPDDRLYVGVDTRGGNQRFELWSLSLSDPSDVRDEHTVVGDFDIVDEQLVWTSTSNEPNDGLHVRDLTTGEEAVTDPQSGDRCNQLQLDANGPYVALGQYCGTRDEVRDDRVQVVTPDGRPVVTVQGDGLALQRLTEHDVVIEVYGGASPGTYVYQLDSQELVRISTGLSSFGLGGPAPDDFVLWHLPVNDRHGATQWLGELLR